MILIKALKPYKDLKLGRVISIGEEYEVTKERYEELKVLEPEYLVGEAIKVETKETPKPVAKKRVTKKK